MSHTESKTRSQGQIQYRIYVHFRGKIIRTIITKTGQHICLYDISDYLQNGPGQIKTQFTRSRGHFLPDTHGNRSMFVLIVSQMSLKMGHVRSNTHKKYLECLYW